MTSVCITFLCNANTSHHSISHNIQLYSELLPVSTKVQQRRMQLAGQGIRHGDEVANKLVLWQPTVGHANGVRQKMTYVDNLLQDTGLGNTSQLQTVLMDRGCWKGCVLNAGRPERRPIREYRTIICCDARFDQKLSL